MIEWTLPMMMRGSGELGAHLLDTGPVLCLGGSPAIAELYDAEFGSDGKVVKVVADEVRGWAVVRVEPGDPDRISGVQRAGAAAVRRYASSLLANVVAMPDSNQSGVDVILDELRAYARRKRPDRAIRDGEHGGEAYSIYEAERITARFISNDDGARLVSSCHSVSHESFVDLARRLSKCQRGLNPGQVVKELQTLMKDGVDTGDVVNSVLDLR
ncbi:MAG: hypothetical protein IT192_06810 [Microbacteriaceae bacterium]|nr:hypothetical protein [Microbacteriaceae bacterium]